MSNQTLLKIADELKRLGHEYYDKGDVNATAIFWELEAVIKKIVGVGETPKQ